MAKASMSVWGFGSIWNLDLVYSGEEVSRIEEEIDSGEWEYETYGEPDEPFESGLTISPGAAKFSVEDSRGKTLFEANVSDLPYSVFSHSFVVLENGCVRADKDFYGVWLYDETAKGNFMSASVSLPKSGFDVKKLRISVKHFVRGGKEIFSCIEDVSYDGECFETDSGIVDFKGGGLLTVY